MQVAKRSFPANLPASFAGMRVFQLVPHSHNMWNIRFYLRHRIGGELRYQVSFPTPHIIHGREGFDTRTNRMRLDAPNAEYINKSLDEMRELAMDGLSAGMNQDEIRELMGIPPTRKHMPYKSRRDKGSMRVDTAKQILLDNGWRHSIRTPEEQHLAAEQILFGDGPELPANPLDLPESDVTRECQAVLDKYEAIYNERRQNQLALALTENPEEEIREEEVAQDLPVREPASVPARGQYIPSDYWLITSSSEQKHLSHLHWNNRQDAEREAAEFSREFNVPAYVVQCRAVAIVHVKVEVSEL